MEDDDVEVDRFLAHCDELLDPPATWTAPPGYPQSLALCVIDAVWSLGIRYDTVLSVVTRYARFRGHETLTACRDGVPDLIAVFDAVGGAAEFADAIGTRQRTSTHAGAPLKAEAVRLAAQALGGLGVTGVPELHHALDGGRRGQVAAAWRRVPGQKSSDIGWRYLLLLAGREEVKPDRMVCRFAAAALGKPLVTSQEAAALLVAAARRRAWSVRTLDHTIWRYQSVRNGRPLPPVA